MSSSQPAQICILAPGSNWIRLGGQIALGLAGYTEPLGHGSSASVHLGHPGILCMQAPRLVGEGQFDLAFTTPAWYAKSSMEGKAIFPERYDLRAIGVFAHDDRFSMAVRTATGISSIEQIPEQKAPLRISMAPRGETHPAGWATEKVFEEYGFSLDDVVSWGGSVTWESRVGDAGRTQLLQRGELDMVCDESIDSWRPFADTVDMTYLPIDADVQARLEQKYGMRPGVIAAGRLRGVKEDLPCLDFRGWLVFTRRDLPEEHAYLAVRAIDQTRSAMDDMFRERRGALHVGMTGHKVDMTQLCQHTEIPLHPGAERYYREKGYL